MAAPKKNVSFPVRPPTRNCEMAAPLDAFFWQPRESCLYNTHPLSHLSERPRFPRGYSGHLSMAHLAGVNHLKLESLEL